jgi:subtilisin family serine protease
MRRLSLLLLAFLIAAAASAQTDVALTQTTVAPVQLATPLGETPALGHLVVVYRGGGVPRSADALAALAGAHTVRHLARFGMSALTVDPDASAEALAIARLRARPEVETVLHDRLVTAHAVAFMRLPLLAASSTSGNLAADAARTSPWPSEVPSSSTPLLPPNRITMPVPTPAPAATDTFYSSPQGWAVVQSGGFGDNLPGSPSATGPWTTTRGAGVRIAVLDSGIDASHPDLAPNLALNLSEIVQSDQPSPCDDGSPQDQQGHGTWVASLAAAAIGGGNTIGVAPQATLLNIKVLQRLPATTGSSTTAQCEAGQAGGLLSWVLQGIDDAVANHASVICLSLGTLVDLTTGDGAGWQTQFDRVTYAAAQAGVVLIAAVGNDGLDLSPTGPNANFLELPAQSRSVLAVTASTNPACAENLAAGATCVPGPITRPYYSDYGVPNALAAPGGSYPEGADTAVSGYVRGACSSGLPNTTDGLPPSSTQPAGQSFGCFGLGHVAYVQAMGTSAAAPLVAGAAALLQAAHPSWTPAQLIAALQSTATNQPSMAEPTLNLPAAMALP